MSAPGFTPISLYHSTTAAATPSAGNLAAGELAVNITDGKLFYKDNGGVVRVLATAAGSAGDVVGPGSSTDNALVRFDGTTGKLVQSSVGILSDAGALSGLTSVAATTFTGALTGNASTATTLQTSRTIWGQSFDGSANVTGALTGVTDLTASGSLTLNGGTANGVAYLNGSKVLTTGSALTFDGGAFSTTGTINAGTAAKAYRVANWTLAGYSGNTLQFGNATTGGEWTDMSWSIAGSEQMRLTSTGLGIGTSSPSVKLSVATAASTFAATFQGSASTNFVAIGTTSFGASINGYTAGFGAAADLVLQPNGGNLGLGVTPSAWSSGFKALQLSSTSITNNGANDSFFGANYFYDGSNNRYINSDFATTYGQVNGQHLWFTAPSGTAGNAISFTQAMTLDASGLLALGTTSPASATRLTLDYPGFVQMVMRSSGTDRISLYGDASVSAVDGKANPLAFYAGSAERARIDPSGALLIGTTSFAAGQNSKSIQPDAIFSSRSTTGGDGHIIFYNPNGVVGQIYTSGSSTTFATSSDYRLKENITPMTGALAVVQQLNPVTYTWKVDGSNGEGFIAHELQEVCPAAVVGEKDAVDADGNPVYQGIDTSFLVATLTAAIQEQQAIIESLKARLDAANL